MEKARNKENNEKQLRAEMELLQGKIDNGIEILDNIDRLTEIKNNLNTIIEEKIEGVRVRAKIEKMELGEKPTKYFFKKEKARGKQKQINSLLTEEGDIITEKDEIMQEIENFYNTLYKSEGIKPEQARENLTYIKTS